MDGEPRGSEFDGGVEEAVAVVPPFSVKRGEPELAVDQGGRLLPDGDRRAARPPLRNGNPLAVWRGEPGVGEGGGARQSSHLFRGDVRGEPPEELPVDSGRSGGAGIRLRRRPERADGVRTRVRGEARQGSQRGEPG